MKQRQHGPRSAEFLFLEEVQRCTGCAEVSHASDGQLHGTLHQQTVLSCEVNPWSSPPCIPNSTEYKIVPNWAETMLWSISSQYTLPWRRTIKSAKFIKFSHRPHLWGFNIQGEHPSSAAWQPRYQVPESQLLFWHCLGSLVGKCTMFFAAFHGEPLNAILVVTNGYTTWSTTWDDMGQKWWKS